MLKIRIFVVILSILVVFVPKLFAEDIKYFSSFSYRQKAIWGSDYFLVPEFRFDQNISHLYYYHVRTGFLFHPRSWLDLGLFYKFVNEKDSTNNWMPENRFEFVFTPKIIIRFEGPWQRVKEAAALVRGEGVIEKVGEGILQVLSLVARNEFEFRELDYQDLSKVHIVYRVRPKISWKYGYGILYVGDEVFYSLKYGEFFQNWATVGFIRSLNGLDLDLFYTYESLRSQPGSNIWENAHVIGTRIIWQRD